MTGVVTGWRADCARAFRRKRPADRPKQASWLMLVGWLMLACWLLAPLPCPAASDALALQPLQPDAFPPILFDDDMPPFAYQKTGNTSQPRGIYPALAAEAFRRMGLDPVMEPAPWARAVSELEAGRAGVCGLYANADRRTRIEYSEPVFEEQLHLVLPVKAHVPPALSTSTGGGTGGAGATGGTGGAGGGAGDPVEALRGMRLGLVRGWTYGDALDAARKRGMFTAEEAGSEAQNMLKVAGGRIDGTIVSRESALWLQQRLGLTRLVKLTPRPLAAMAGHLAFRRQAGKTALLRAFDEAIRAMRADGTYQRIVEAALNGE